MRPLIVLLTLLLAAAASPSGARADDLDRTCLTGADAQAPVNAGLARRLSAFKGQYTGELIRADLCRNGAGFVYVVTTLDPSGKVRRQVFDATPGPAAVAPFAPTGAGALGAAPRY